MENIIGGDIALKNIVNVDIFKGLGANNFVGTGKHKDGFLYGNIFVDEDGNPYPVYNKDKSVVGAVYASSPKSYFEGDESIVSYSEAKDRLRSAKSLKLNPSSSIETDSYVK